MQHIHIPVLLNEVLQYLDPKPGETIIDGTLGEGGHALAILERIAPDPSSPKAGRLIAFDLDAPSIGRARERLSRYQNCLQIVNRNFTDMVSAVCELIGDAPVHGILLDLGLSRFEIKEGSSGFSFEKDEQLDMRLDRSQRLTASEIVNQWPQDKLAWIFQEYGQEKFSYSIAAYICRIRRQKHITTTRQLTETILLAIRTALKSTADVPWVGGRHPATRIYQALRIAVNNEYENLKHVLPEALELLTPAGRLAVISFHSGEDRIVKKCFQDFSRGWTDERDTWGKRISQPVRATLLTKRPVAPTSIEIKTNSSSRSAKLRAIQKSL